MQISPTDKVGTMANGAQFDFTTGSLVNNGNQNNPAPQAPKTAINTNGQPTTPPTPTTPTTPATPATPAKSQTTQPSQSNTGSQTSTLFNFKTISDAISAGFHDPQSISNSTGIPLDEVTNDINSNPDYQKAIKDTQDVNNLSSQADAAFQKVQDIGNGIFTLSADEQAQVTSLQNTYADAVKQMMTANQALNNSTMGVYASTGALMTANQQAMGVYTDVVNQGTMKIQNLEAESIAAVAKLKQSFKDNDYKQASDLYDAIEKQMSNKTDEITKINKATTDLYNSVNANHQQALKDAQLAQTTASKQIVDLAPQVAQYIQNGDKQSISDMATFYGLDETTLTAAGQKYVDTSAQKGTQQQKYQQQMSEKGWSYVNTPAQRDSLKKQGWTIQQGADGKTYAKAPLAPKMTQKTVKVGSGKTSQTYLINYKDGVEVSREKMGGGGGGTVKASSVSNTNSVKTAKKATAAKFDKQTAATEMEGAVKSQLGPEGKISKEDWGTLLAQWENAGGTKSNFIDNFSKYANPNYEYDYQGLPKVK